MELQTPSLVVRAEHDMADDKELRAGLLSGIIAGAMVLALTAMAFLSFDPAHAMTPTALRSAATFVTISDMAVLSR